MDMAAPTPPLRGEGGDARHQYHAALPGDVVVPEEGLRRHLPRLVSGPNHDDDKFAGGGIGDTFKDYSEQLRRILRVQAQPAGRNRATCCAIEKDGKVVVGEMEESLLFQKDKDKAALGAFYYDSSLPAREDATPVVVAFVLGDGDTYVAGTRALDSRSDGLAFPREDTVPFIQTLVGDGRATEQGVYYHDVLLPPENVVLVPAAQALRAPRPASPYYAVQAGDPIAVGVKQAGGADAGGDEHGSLSAVLGVVVASSAATALAAGSVGPAAAFGLFAALLGGLSLAMASVRAR